MDHNHGKQISRQNNAWSWFGTWYRKENGRNRESFLQITARVVFRGIAFMFRMLRQSVWLFVSEEEVCYVILQTLMQKLLIAKANPKKWRLQMYPRLLQVAIELGYHHGITTIISGDQESSGCGVFSDLFNDDNINLDVVKIVFQLGMLTNKDMYKLQRLIRRYKRNFASVNAIIQDCFDGYEPEIQLPDDDLQEDDRAGDDADEITKVMRFIAEASSSPRSLKDLAAMEVSRKVGYGKNREEKMRTLQVPREVLADLLFHDALCLVYKH